MLHNHHRTKTILDRTHEINCASEVWCQCLPSISILRASSSNVFTKLHVYEEKELHVQLNELKSNFAMVTLLRSYCLPGSMPAGEGVFVDCHNQYEVP